MATKKKIIAVCQSGGEFVMNKDGSLSYTGGDAYALDLDEQTKLSNFKHELAETFHCSNPDAISIKYFLPGNRKTLISISKDKDISRMVNFVADSDQVDVFLTIDQTVVARNVSNSNNVPASRSTVSETGIPMDTQVDTPPIDEPLDTCMPDETPPSCGGVIDNDDENYRRTAMVWENAITGVNQIFSTFSEFRDALHKYSIARGFGYKYKKNDSHRVTVKCKAEGCPWRIYASRSPTTQMIYIKTMRPKHTCEGPVAKTGYRATRSWVGSIIKEKLKASPNYKPKDIVTDIEKEFGIQLNYSQAWRAKEMAREQLQGSYKEAYSQLPYFCEKIKETNPGSIATFVTKEDSSFHRLFVSFHASVAGFQRGCRPLLFLDSTPLNSKYQETLIAATAVDGNDDVFPVAFAVVDIETDDNWRWFLLELKSAVSTSDEITFVADFQKGLRESIGEVFQKGHHAYCLRYLAEKLNSDLKGQFSHEARRLMIQDFYAAAYAPKLETFEHCMENIRAISPEAYNWVVQSEPDHWANAFFRGARYNHMTCNFGELFYSWVLEANELPITQLVNVLRGKMMESIYTRRVDSSPWVTRLTPIMEEKLLNETSKARSLQVSLLQGSTFEVRGESVDAVDIDQWDCSCKEWQLMGLPCCHAIAVLECVGRSPYDYCSRYFTVESYRLTYAESINPVPNVEKPDESELAEAIITVTPPVKRLAGRPKMKPAGPVEIIKRTLQCSKCKGIGHNKRKCGKSMRIEEASNLDLSNVSRTEEASSSDPSNALRIEEASDFDPSNALRTEEASNSDLIRSLTTTTDEN